MITMVHILSFNLSYQFNCYNLLENFKNVQLWISVFRLMPPRTLPYYSKDFCGSGLCKNSSASSLPSWHEILSGLIVLGQFLENTLASLEPGG